MNDPLDHWPRLSETLTGLKDVDHCQSCGMPGWVDPPMLAEKPTLYRWREHNQFDKPERIVVVLCHACSDRLIEKHERLYSRIPSFEPTPGAMPICSDCRHRDGTACTSPLAKFNGGEGIVTDQPKPTEVHVNRGRKGSGWELWWSGPTTKCTGKEVDPQ